jgi:hypothetical protein
MSDVYLPSYITEKLPIGQIFENIWATLLEDKVFSAQRTVCSVAGTGKMHKKPAH